MTTLDHAFDDDDDSHESTTSNHNPTTEEIKPAFTPNKIVGE